MAKKPIKKPAKSSGGKAKKAAKPAAKKAPVKKKAAKPAKKAVQKVVKKAAPKKPVKAVKQPVAKKPVAKPGSKPVAGKAVSQNGSVHKKGVEMKKAVVSKIPVKLDVRVEKPAEPKKEVVMVKPYIKVEKPKNPQILKQDPRSRYSDKELVEFKELINKKLEEATRDYELLKNTLSHKDDHGTDDTSPTFKLLEDGSDVLSKEETAHLASRQEKYIQNLKNALIRIENKTYGICRVTGKLIPKERLRSVPHATLSIDAKMEQNR
jgi:RNA polymerase-binding transcription factor DksA